VETQVEELADNRVRLTVDVPSHDVKHAVEHAASDLAVSLKIPGFRKGKVPMPVLIARVGKDRIYAEAVDSHIGGWFWNAAARSRIRPVSQPEYDFALPSTDREDWSFSATVAVQPRPELVDWKTLEVPKPSTEVPEDLVEHELNVLRSAVAELSTVEGRPVQPGDTAVLDLVNPSGEAQRDYVVEVGSGRLVGEIEHALLGMETGETKEVEFELADDASGSVGITVKEIKEKVLPPVDDDLARASSEFGTLAELRSALEEDLREQIEDAVDTSFRAAAVDALVEASQAEPSAPLVEVRTRELLNGLVRSVESRGISFDTYLALTGGTPEELVERLRAEATRAVARELVLETAADDLAIEVSDEEIKELVREQAEAAGDDPEEAIAGLWASGSHERLREDLRLRKTLDRIAAEVQPIPVELARAREQLWTPGKEKTPSETNLWTPGSKERA
jgi:trigger factor